MPFKLDWDGGVDPEENLDDRLDIHEFRRPFICLGLVFGGAREEDDSFASIFGSTGGRGISTGAGFSSILGRPFSGSLDSFGEGPLEGDRAGLLLERFRRW